MRTLAGTFSNPRQMANGSRQKTSVRNLFYQEQKRLSACLWLLAAIFCLLALTACGKIGDPLPPIPRAPLTVDELNVVQQGSQLLLSFPLVRPPRAERPARIDIFRLIEPENGALGLTQADFAARASVITSIPGEQVESGATIITYQDALDLTQPTKGMRHRYAVRLFNQDGRGADFSNFALITPLTDLASAPVNLQANVTQTELTLAWAAPAANESGTTPANIAGYNLYRKAGENFVKLNAQPLKEPRYVEKSFQFGAPYEFVVRALSFTPGNANLSEAIEGNASASLAYTPKDTFPPTAPAAITIASINAQVSLFWPSNPEPDLAGYNVYRTDEENAPADKWVKLNPKLHTPTTFRDDRVQVGKRYFYQLTAVDTAGNESARSETASETVNP
jgi:hypothetical protein